MFFKVFFNFCKNNVFVCVCSHKNTVLYQTSKFAAYSSSSKQVFIYAERVSQKIWDFFKVNGNKKPLFLFIKGFGLNRIEYLKVFFKQASLPIFRLFFIQSKPFNGCKSKKQRRILRAYV